MRAAVLHEHGVSPAVEDWPDPQPAAGRVTLRVTAAPIVPLDLLIATGTSYLGRPPLPYVPGSQGVGVDEAERRHFFTTTAGMSSDQGSHAEACSIDEGRTLELTDDLDAVSDAMVAALGLSAVAAMGALQRGQLQQGETVAVLGASGIVGQVAVQMARRLGAGRVVAVVRGPAAAGRVTGLGADEVVELGADPPELVASRLSEAAGGALDLVVDPIWGAPAEAAFAALAPGGRLVNFGDTAGRTASFASASLRSRTVSVLGYTNLALSWQEQAALLTEVLVEAAAGRLQLAFDTVPLADAGSAWQRQADPSASGRVVLLP